jgi:hypothetical protein
MSIDCSIRFKSTGSKGTDLRGKSESQVKVKVMTLNFLKKSKKVKVITLTFLQKPNYFDFFAKTEKSQSHDFDFDLTF